jgi:hypothetical protein
MNKLHAAGGHDALRPTTGIFNVVIKTWARSKEKVAPLRVQQILTWMQMLRDVEVRPDKYMTRNSLSFSPNTGTTKLAGTKVKSAPFKGNKKAAGENSKWKRKPYSLRKIKSKRKTQIKRKETTSEEITRRARRREGGTYRQHLVCVADMDGTLMAQGVDCWKSVTALPWAR